jgi:preprotein translocase subunit SecE
MATEPAKKVPRRRKAPETVRERAQKDSAKKEAPKKSTAVKARIHRPLSKLRRLGAKEYHPIKVPEKRGVKHLNKRVNLVPKYVRESWAELKLVTWPTKKEAAQKTIAVIAFAIVIAILVQLLDLLFSKVVKEIILR